ncbi:hypothetical protein SOHN41_01584 [Shewanella sp. HN-41]|nr:hypothetical protein SOHN41_01584 [Shewanella sp. HN-41]
MEINSKSALEMTGYTMQKTLQCIAKARGVNELETRWGISIQV